jgi:NADPH:quinone reductase-like Zn-dependent oxidoreductase
MADNTMRAVRFHDYGPPENLVVERVPRPEPKAGEVLVRVHAAGVNPVDWKIRKGFLKDNMPIPLPSIPGADVAGIVEDVGPDVSTFQRGQAVFGRATGAYAEYAVAPATTLALKPRHLSFDEAATIPIGACTAWRGIFDVGGLQAGQRLLVHGAAGGVGLFAVQLGRWKGAHVIGTASAANVEFVRSLGAETVIDYGATRFEDVVRDVDVVLDTIGGAIQDRSWQLLKAGGILVETGGPIQEQKAKEHGVRASSVASQVATDLLQQISDLVEAGTIVAVVGKVFPLEEARQAHTLSETGHGRGRIVLHIAD